MIEYKSGDILAENAEALVNTVNCVGVMGRGIALQFKKAFSANYAAYSVACKQGKVQPGQMFIIETGRLGNPKYIVNFPTKRHWRDKSRMEDIESGLDALAQDVIRYGIHSIAIPPLGSGLGGLDWEQVRPRIERTFKDMDDVRVIIFEPSGAPVAENMVRNCTIPNMTPGRAALVGLMNRYLQGLLDPFVTLLEVHKLMYFMQEVGEPLRLRYKKAPYGPYAENLRHVLNEIEGHLISGYVDGGDNPEKQLSIVQGVLAETYAFLQQHQDTQQRFTRVEDLVAGFESPFGLELLATVHWVVTHEGIKEPDAVVQHVHSWNERKKQFTPRQIGIALNTLQQKGWLE